MSVKMDRYEIIGKTNDFYSKSGKSRGIKDNKYFQVIMSFDTYNEELNQKFAELMLNELNTGKYEELL